MKKKVILIFLAVCFALAFIILGFSIGSIIESKKTKKLTPTPYRTSRPRYTMAPAPTEVPKELWPVLSIDEAISLGKNVQVQGTAVKFIGNTTLLIETDEGYACVTILFEDYGLFTVEKGKTYKFYGVQWTPTITKDSDGFQQKFPTLMLKHDMESIN